MLNFLSFFRHSIFSRLPERTVHSSLHGCWRNFRLCQNVLAAVEAAAHAKVGGRSDERYFDRLKSGVLRLDCFPYDMVRHGKLLDSTHQMARLRSDALRTESMVPSHSVRVRRGAPVHSVHSYRCYNFVGAHFSWVPVVWVPLAWTHKVQIARTARLFRTLGCTAYVSLNYKY